MTVEGTRSLPGEMSADKTPGLDPTLCLKAAQSILQFHAKEANQSRQSLLEDAKGINLVTTPSHAKNASNTKQRVEFVKLCVCTGNCIQWTSRHELQ